MVSPAWDPESLDAPWRIGERSFAYISALIREHDLTSVLEFGSGASTARLASEFPELSITSVEHDGRFFEQTKTLLEEGGLDRHVRLLFLPLERFFVDRRPYWSYGPVPIDRELDLVIVDGPPQWTRRGREACLYRAYHSLRVGGLVVLDDARRRREARIVRNWLSVYPDSFSYRFVESNHGLVVLEKMRHLPHRDRPIQVMLDAYMAAAGSLVPKPVRSFGRGMLLKRS